MEKRRLIEAINEWLEVFKQNSVKTLTYDRLLIARNLMTRYDICEIPVDEMTCSDIQRYITQLLRDGYSMSTIKKQFNLITAYWKHAMAQGLVTTPIYLGVKLPSEELLARPTNEIEVYSHDEQRRLLAELMTLEKEQYAVVVLMLEEGLRVGEALALRWENVNWAKRSITIRSTLIRLSTEAVTYVQNAPKSKSSRRTIPLSNRAYEVLQRLADHKGTHGLVFAKPDDPSMPYSYSSVEFHIKRLCKDLVISYKGMHAFRHTFATNCYERGCDVKILSKLLGHADVSITYNIYIHLYGDELENMRNVIG